MKVQCQAKNSQRQKPKFKFAFTTARNIKIQPISMAYGFGLVSNADDEIAQ